MTITHTGSSYSHDYQFHAKNRGEAIRTAWRYWNSAKYRAADLALLDYDPTEAALIRETRKRCLKMLKQFKVTRKMMQEYAEAARELEHQRNTLDMMRDLIAGQDQLGSSNESVMLRLWKYARTLRDTDYHQEAMFVMNGYFHRLFRNWEVENAMAEMKRKLEKGDKK